MAYDQYGQGGLRRRLKEAVEPPSNIALVAATLGIDPLVLDSYLAYPDYILSPDDYNLIMLNLQDLPFNRHIRSVTDTWTIYFDEKPQWTPADVTLLEPPSGAENVVLFLYNANYPDRIASAGPFDLNVFTVQQVIDAATQGDPSILVTVVWYVSL